MLHYYYERPHVCIACLNKPHNAYSIENVIASYIIAIYGTRKTLSYKANYNSVLLSKFYKFGSRVGPCFYNYLEISTKNNKGVRSIRVFNVYMHVHTIDVSKFIHSKCTV